mmetsp:Transcript_22326/g.37815  ORF Transcript_22326/g.37815 Transcript_22326/m.37815 type:complete len:599 (+) Transcript_22326:105-1901(+)
MQSVSDLKRAEIENSIVNGYHTIMQAIRQIENGMTESLDGFDMLKKLFDRETGGSNSKWSFFDDIVQKYLASPSPSSVVQEMTGDEEDEEGAEVRAALGWRERLACALVAVCLCDYDEMVRFVFDIFALSSSTRAEMNMQDYMNVLRTVLPRQNAEDGSFDNYINAFELYVSSHPVLPATRRRSNDHDQLDGQESESDTSFPTSIAVQYHVKVHKELLWPLKVAHEQVKKKFLGVNYWTGMHSEMAESPDSCSMYLPGEAASFSSFVDVLLSLSSSHHWVSKLPIPPSSPSCSTATSNCSSTRSSPLTVPREIVEADGIYTYRHLESVGVGRSKYTSCSSPPTVVHLHSAVDQLMKGTSASTASRRFPSPEHSPTRMNADIDGVKRKKMRSRSVPDMRRTAASTVRNMSGFNILIIEDSKLQRKMMRHQLCKTGMTTFEKKDTETHKGSTSSTDPGDEIPLTSAARPSVPVPMPLESVVALSDAERQKVWTVSEASNGEEAIQMIIDTKSSFNVMFVDENLQHSGGNMLGHEFVSILRGHNSVPPTTVIIGCSSNAHVYVSNFLNAGADAVWQKPMPSSEMIHSEICKYVDRRMKCSL